MEDGATLTASVLPNEWDSRRKSWSRRRILQEIRAEPHYRDSGFLQTPMQRTKPAKLTSLTHLATVAFSKYAPALHRYVLRRLRQPEDAPDLTQVIFERFLAVENAELVRNPQAYLFGIASHVVSEYRMREHHNPVTYDSEIVEQAAENLEHATPDNLAERLGAERAINEALACLPDMHRAVLLMVKREGMSYEEAARASKLTVNTIGTYVMEARAKVKAFLEQRA